jgi:predicted transcriptional regulator
MELNLNEDGIEVYKALASETRVQILDILANRPATASELAAELNMSKAILSRHLKMLEEVHLIHQSHNYASADSRKKVYSLNVDQIVINFPKRIYLPFRKKVSEVPLGLYSDFDVQPTCGLASADSTIGEFDDPRAFVLNQRINASLLWFSKGFVEYKIPNLLDQNERPEMLELSLELSSEFPGSNNNWPSDITFYINDVEVGTWTCPGNFSDVRGKLTPAWWDSRYSQYGQLIHIRINHEDTGIEAHHVSNVKLEDLHLEDSPVIALRIAVRENAEHVGGVTIFGEHFGNNPQNILLSMYYSTADKSVN